MNLCAWTATPRLRKARIEAMPGKRTTSSFPQKLERMYKTLDDTSDPVELVITETKFGLKQNWLFFLRFGRKLSGYIALIPTDSKQRLSKTKDLLHSIDRASLLAREHRNHVVRCTTIDERTLEISSISPEVGKVVEELPCESIEGEELKIAFSAKYVMEALKALEGTDIKINFTGAMRPFIIRPIGDESILQLILPVRTY